MIGPPSWLPLLAAVGATGGGEAVDANPATLAAAIGLLVLSAFFSGSETALFSLQPVDRQAIPEPGRARVAALLKRPRQTLATLLIGNELVNVTLSSITAGILLTLFPDQPWMNLVVLTPVLLVAGEVLPKVFALRTNRRVAPIVALPLRTFSTVVTPVRWVLTKVADLFLVVLGGTAAPGQAEIREAQLRQLIDQGREAGSLKPMEQEMLHKVFDFGELTVARLMTPRPDVFSLGLTTPWDDALARIRESGFSRIPIYKGSRDDIVGVLVVKSLLPFLERARVEPDFRLSPRELKALLLPPRFVPTSKKADELLQEFRTERFHMAIVVDEHGSVVGIVTLDDLLAELVGELLDETDADDPEVTAIDGDRYTVRGSMDVDDFEERFGVALPEGGYTTVGGFILDQVGELPDKGEEVDAVGLRFVVSGVEGRRVTEVCVCPLPPEVVAGEAR
jgi:putative hemolysin